MDLLWFVMMDEQWEQLKVEKVFMIAWALWTNRNECRTGGVKKPSQVLLQGALNYLMEYQACSLLSDGSTPPTKVS